MTIAIVFPANQKHPFKVQGGAQACRHLHFVLVILVLYSCRNSWASFRETIRKMYFGKQFWQSLACFVLGGIITVIFIKILEWQRDQNNEELGDRRILVPVQEVGDGEREEPMEIRKFPREQDEF